MNIGYIRTGTSDIKPIKQLDGVFLDKCYEETIGTAEKERPVLVECMNYVREGDILHIESMDRLARSIGDLRYIINYLNSKHVVIFFHKEKMLFSSYSPTSANAEHLEKAEDMPSPSLFHVLDTFADFEKNIRRERQQEGIDKAKKEGRPMGRPAKISFEQRKEIYKAIEQGQTPALLAKEYGVSLSLIYKIQKRVAQNIETKSCDKE